ncbi:MAG TPA: hypothetical protein VMT70_17350 [Vicinamibacteria bacterium]|nr:hypothetical protein [Vicinamibacteria bacterium]
MAAAYTIGVQAPPPVPPEASGDFRASVRLQRLEPGGYEWTVGEELAVGSVRPADLATALTAFLRGAESRDAAAARAAVAASLPRTSALLSRLLRVEDLSLARDAQGATRVALGIRIVPEGLRASAPHYAAFLDKYATPVRATLRLADLQGRSWWTVEGASNLWTVRLRVRDGSLVPLEGAGDTRLPEDLRAAVAYETKMGLFHVGMDQLGAEVKLTRTPLEKGLLARFVQAPDWKLPFLVEPLLRSSLRYPFEGPGSEMGWAARAAPGGPTLLVGRYRWRTHESWILRWLGGMTSAAVEDFRRGAEVEADRFNRECFLALGDDLAALASSP